MRRFVVIPAFNEESTIRPLVESLLPLVESVIVVDDCSNDQTCAEALAGGALVSRHSSNSGYDAALDTGIMLALGRGATSILTLDADGQHPLGYVNRMFDFVEQGHAEMGVLVCGSANGVAITANKHAGIRAAICWEKEIAILARAHNNANIICIPARFVSTDTTFEMVDAFLATSFEGGRHQTRVGKI